MSTLMDLTVVLVVCPALLAGWVDARYPKLRPTQLRRTALHLGAAGLLAFLLMRPLLVAVGDLLHGPTGQAALVAIACTIITYALVVSLWIMRSAAELARG